MIKFLVGIVTLVAAVMLSSPAFGALITFDNTVTENDPGIYLGTWAGNNSNDPNLLSNVNFGLNSEGYGPISALSEYEKVEDFGGANGYAGRWETDLPVTFYSLKGANNYAMFFLDPAVSQGTFTTDGFLTTNSGNTPDLSHITFYNANPVPISPAIWLLGSGVLGLLAVRRRRS